MNPGTSGSLSNTAAVILALCIGAGLFFLAFAGIFVGLWILPIAVMAGYFVSAALLAMLSRAKAWMLAAALVAPGAPMSVNFFFALIPEAGIRRAALWPAGLGAAFLVALLGAVLRRRLRPIE